MLASEFPFRLRSPSHPCGVTGPRAKQILPLNAVGERLPALAAIRRASINSPRVQQAMLNNTEQFKIGGVVVRLVPIPVMYLKAVRDRAMCRFPNCTMFVDALVVDRNDTVSPCVYPSASRPRIIHALTRAITAIARWRVVEGSATLGADKLALRGILSGHRALLTLDVVLRAAPTVPGLLCAQIVTQERT